VTFANPVGNAPVALSATSVAVVRSLSVGPTPLGFGSWAINKPSSALVLTALNTGNVGLTGMTYNFGGGSGVFTQTGGTCGATLAAGATCTINVVFTPTAAVAYTRTLTIAATSLVPSSVVTLTGTGVSGAGATAAVTPTPRLTITLPSGTSTGNGVVTLTNTAQLGGAQLGVNSVAVAGSGTPATLTWFLSPVAGGDNCTGVLLAPQAFCSVQVSFTNVLSARGTNRDGTITFALSGATTATAVGNLRGFATP
jgi:hypothetical protein